MAESFGTELKRARIEKKIPLKAVADELGLSIPYVSDMERGFRYPPSPDKVETWAQKIGYDANRAQALAATARPTIELPIAQQNDRRKEIAYSLARMWDSLTEEEEQKLLAELTSLRGDRR